MKTLYESILDNEEVIYKNAEEQAKATAFQNCIVKLDKNDIIITPDDGYPRAICKNIPGKHKIIVKDIGILSIRSGVDGDTVKRIISDNSDGLNLEFSDEWEVGGTPPPKKTVFKNCEIKMRCARIFYPIEFQNCTFNLSGKCIDFCYNIVDIKDLRKFKVDAQKYNGVYIDVYQTPLGDDMYKHYKDDKYWEKMDKELDKIFKALIQKGRRCAIRYEKDWSREYSPYGKCWVNHYGYVTV